MYRPEFLPEQIVLKEIEAQESDGFLLCTLPTRERYRIKFSPRERPVHRPPTLLSQELRNAVARSVQEDFSNLTWREALVLLEKTAANALHGQFGLGGYDSGFWARKFREFDPAIDRIFPHWFFSSVLSAFQEPELYTFFPRPNFITDLPVKSELSDIGVKDEDLDIFLRETPPILVSAAVPLCGNFGSHDVGDPEYTFVRQRRGEIATGSFSFPGGRADSLLEATALREAEEEVAGLGLLLKGGNGDPSDGPLMVGSVQSYCKSIRLLAIVDQVLVGKDGQLCRYLNYLYVFRIAFPYMGGGPKFWGLAHRDDARIVVEGGDELGDWRVVNFGKDFELLDSEVSANLSPIARVALRHL